MGLAGGIAGVLAASVAPPPIVTSLSQLALGTLTAARARLGPALVVVLAVALGVIHGWLNGAGIAPVGREASGLIGIAATIFVVVALASALAVSLRRPWKRIAVRVIGGWIAAVGLLMLGWGLRGALV